MIKDVSEYAHELPGYWTMNDFENMRLFFDSFMREKEKDPLVANNWYSVSVNETLDTKVWFTNISAVTKY